MDAGTLEPSLRAIWDAQNESVTEETGKAIQAVRGLDMSNRPWDNGYGSAQSPGDSFESHPYLFSNPNFKLSGLARTPACRGAMRFRTAERTRSSSTNMIGSG